MNVLGGARMATRPALAPARRQALRRPAVVTTPTPTTPSSVAVVVAARSRHVDEPATTATTAAAATTTTASSAPSRAVSARASPRNTSANALAVELGSATSSTGSWEGPPMSDAQSYSEQYDKLFAALPLDVKKPVAKPDRSLQAREPGASRVPLSDVFTVPKTRSFFGRTWAQNDLVYAAFMVAMHGLALLAPATYAGPQCWAWFFASYFVTGCLGITLSFHRQLSHRSFQTPKWLEYLFAYCGVLAVQGDPIEWASSHRFHHLHCDTPLDPHSPYEGFWWSHAGWLLDHGATMERVGARGNTGDLDSQPFYRFIERTYPWHVAAQFAALWFLGGLPALVWAGALRVCWVYHVTWFVNSICHVWGSQTYDAGDLSRNNWLVGILAFGEGWHNNHHAFEFSARHGLERAQVDVTWMVIRALEAVGLATNVKLPSERQKERLLIKKSDESGGSGSGGAAPAAA